MTTPVRPLLKVCDAALKRDQTPQPYGENGRDVLTDDEDQRSLRESELRVAATRTISSLDSADLCIALCIAGDGG